MRHIQLIVPAKTIPEIIDDPDRGVISLIGDRGGLSQITGDVERSSVMGGLAVETEHGTVYFDPEDQIHIDEAVPYDDQHEWLGSWTIDSYGAPPAEAAARVWRQHFGRTLAGNDDACVFTVVDSESKTEHTVDLSEVDLTTGG